MRKSGLCNLPVCYWFMFYSSWILNIELNISCTVVQVIISSVSSPWMGCWCFLSRKRMLLVASCLASCCPAHWATASARTPSSRFPPHGRWSATGETNSPTGHILTYTQTHSYWTYRISGYSVHVLFYYSLVISLNKTLWDTSPSTYSVSILCNI